MQTKKQVMRRVRSMMADVRAEVLKECERLLDSGGLDLEAASDKEGEGCMRVPKLVLVAAMRRAACQWSPLSWDNQGKRELRNLERM